MYAGLTRAAAFFASVSIEAPPDFRLAGAAAEEERRARKDEFLKGDGASTPKEELSTPGPNGEDRFGSIGSVGQRHWDIGFSCDSGRIAAAQ
jgi:hypothetical protein